MSHSPFTDLRNLIAQRQVIAVIGTGVSVAASGNAPAASWIGLLEDGITYCEQNITDLSKGWGDRARADLESGDLTELLAAAQKVSSKLGAPAGGEFKKWLRQSVGELPLRHREVIEALDELEVPLATTNYDSLLEEVTCLPYITWRAGSEVERVLRGDDRAIFHLHGHWNEPESVVLGVSSYEQILGDAHAQTVLRAVRTTRSLLYVGLGQGLSDPNFGSLLRWARSIFAGSEYRHYLLARNMDVERLQREYTLQEDRIFVLSYGESFDDLAPFLRSLRPSPHTAPREVIGGAGDLSTHDGAYLPVPRCIGRDEVVADIVATLLSDPPPPLPVLGSPGIGKSTVTLAALHDRRVAARYKERRYFIRCEGAKTAEALVNEVAQAIGVELGPDLRLRTFTELERAAAVLVLDNLETPWEADTTSTEELLSELGAVSDIALVGTIRGGERPFGPLWRESIHLTPLEEAQAKELFLAVAGQKFRDDETVPELVNRLDRVPLAVELMAYQAQAEPDLRGIKRRWESKRTEMLRRAQGRERVTNIEVSFELSITGARMTEEGRQLLFAMGLLPDGVARQDLESLMPGVGEEAAATLRRVGLGFDEGGRLRLLAPLREYVRRHYEPSADLAGRLVGHYMDLATEHGNKVGRSGGREATERLTSEMGNLEALILRELDGPDPLSATRGALALVSFQQASGYGTTTMLQKAREVANRICNYELEAQCIHRLGSIALQRSDHEEARRRFEEALLLSRRIGDVIGEVNCIRGLGEIALRRSDHEEARHRFEEALLLSRRSEHVLGEANCLKGLADIALWQSNLEETRRRFEEALALFHQIGNVLGEANCLRGLADIALWQSDLEETRRRFEEALPLYRRVGSVLGEANCIRGFGEIALRQSDLEEARRRFYEALPLYRRVGSVAGEANCIAELGEIALQQSDLEEARRRFEEALALFRRVRELVGEANCIKGLGDIARQRSEYDDARLLYLKALTLYKGIGNPYSIGIVCASLAQLVDDPVQYVNAAREAWMSINRQDLVQMLDEEFGPPSG